MANIFDKNIFDKPTTGAPVQNAGFDASPIGKITNFFAAIPQATFDTGKTLVQSLFRIPAELGISSAQAGTAIADRLLGTDYLSKSLTPIATTGMSALLGSEPLKGYAPQIQELSDSIAGSAFAKKNGLDKISTPLAFAGIVGGTALNFDGAGGEENLIKAIAKQTDPARIFTMLVDSGVEKTIAAKAANHLADVSAPAEVKATLDTLHGVQSVHEATDSVPQLAKMIQEQHPDIQYSKLYDIAERAGLETDRSPAAIEQFVNDEIGKIPKDSIPHYPDFTNERARAPEIKISEPTARGRSIDTETPIFRGGAKLDESRFGKNGASFSTDEKVAKSFAGSHTFDARNPGVVEKRYLSPDAKILSYDELPENLKNYRGKDKGTSAPSDFELDKVAQYAKENGYDGVDLSGFGKKTHFDTLAEREIRILNPEVLKTEPVRVSVGEGAQQSAEAKAAQEEAAAAAGKPSIQDNVPLPPSVGDILANGKRIPIEKTPATAIDDLAKGSDAKSWQSLVRGFMYNFKAGKRAHIFDYLATPEFVLEKVGLGKGAEMLQNAKDQVRTTLKTEFTKIHGWQERVANQVKDGQVHTEQDTARLIFQYLDGKEKDVVPEMTEAEHAVAQEIRGYLKEWADRLKLPEDNQISRYITHIFERTAEGTDNAAFLDPELAALMAEQPAKSVYDPFLEKRLGKQGYIEDVWRALDAYVKRASRKEAMDPALEQLAEDAKHLDEYTYNYVVKMSHRINMRPTEIEKGMDNFIKQTRIGHYFTDRPTAFISKAIRKVFYRGTLGLNFSSALRNLTQGANTYAKLGEKYTVVGYAKLFSKIVSRNLDELEREGILSDELIQDKNMSAIKKTMQTVDNGLFSLFQMAEKINRGSAYFGAKAKALDKELSEEEAVKYAKRIVRETQFAFGAVDTPVALNDDVVKTLSQLQTYNVKQAEFLSRMLLQGDYLGLLRWTGASLGMVYTIGRLFGMTPSQIIPTIGIGGAPLTSAAIGVGEALSGDAQTHAKGVSQIWRSGASVFPAGAQIRKTLQGAADLQRGKDVTAKGQFRFRVDHKDAIQALLFGPSSLPQAQKYYDSIGKKKASTGNIFD